MTPTFTHADVERWVREIADLTGETPEEVVAVSVRQRLTQLRPATAEDLLAIGREVAARLPDDQRYIDHGEVLYDDLGLPR